MRSTVVALVFAFLWHAGSASAQAVVAQPDPAAPVQPEIAAPVAPNEVMDLPASLRERLHRAILQDNPSPHERLERLGVFMFAPEGLGMTYVETANLTVSQAYEARTANCLTFTLLFL